jgi:hypothetical protein
MRARGVLSPSGSQGGAPRGRSSAIAGGEADCAPRAPKIGSGS